MLGDNPEKSKNPLKKAMKRRNAKTVQFTAPTYVEASDVDYSTEEEDEEGEGDYFGQGADEETADAQDQQQDSTVDESAIIEPLKSSGQLAINPQAAIDPRVDAPSQKPTAEKAQTAEDAVETIGMLSALSLLLLRLQL